MDFIEWFDPYNHNHTDALVYLQETGCWPEGFIPEEVELQGGWTRDLNRKLANAWIMYRQAAKALAKAYSCQLK